MSPPTRLQGPGPPGVTRWSVSSCVEGSQCDQIRSIAGQVSEVHASVRDKNDLHLLTLVLLISLPVVDLQQRTQTLSTTLVVTGLFSFFIFLQTLCRIHRFSMASEVL